MPVLTMTREAELDHMLASASPDAIAKTVRTLLAQAHSGLKHGYQSQNLSCKDVCRGCWATSVLLDAGVISSVDEVPPYSAHIRTAREKAGLDVETGKR
jgi:hypothetical protein